MARTQIKKIVAEQIIVMWENNILQDCGGESIIGWLEDGDMFFNGENPEYTEEEVAEIMAFVREIADLVDTLSWKLDPQNEF